MSRRFAVRLLAPGSSDVQVVTMQGSSAGELRERLAAGGTVVLSVRGASIDWRAWMRASRSRFDVAAWCRELETLVRAGMSPVEAIETMAEGAAAHDAGSERTRVQAELLGLLQQGSSLSVALRRLGAFPEVLIAGVAASERTSGLAQALAGYLEYHELLHRMRKQVVNAALYPALVVSLGAAISCFLLLYVLPRFGRMYEGLQAGRSLPTELVLAASAALREHGWLVASATLAAGALLLAAWRGGHLQRALAALVRDVRPLHRQVFHFRTAQLFQALALLVRGGYTVDQALAVAASMDLGHDVRERIRVARAAVAEGKSLSTALAAAGLADITATRLLAVGERGGEIDRVLQTVGARHAGLFATFVERATRLVEPVLLLAVALVVGGLVLLMYMPIFDIAGGLGAGR